MFLWHTGLHRGYSDDAVENDEIMTNATPLPPRGKNQQPPPRPPRKGSLSRHDDLLNENGILFLVILNKSLNDLYFNIY